MCHAPCILSTYRMNLHLNNTSTSLDVSVVERNGVGGPAYEHELLWIKYVPSLPKPRIDHLGRRELGIYTVQYCLYGSDNCSCV